MLVKATPTRTFAWYLGNLIERRDPEIHMQAPSFAPLLGIVVPFNTPQS
jgi:hypothetical protein